MDTKICTKVLLFVFYVWKRGAQNVDESIWSYKNIHVSASLPVGRNMKYIKTLLLLKDWKNNKPNFSLTSYSGQRHLDIDV